MRALRTQQPSGFPGPDLVDHALLQVVGFSHPGSAAGRVSLVRSDHDSRRRILEILIAGKHRPDLSRPLVGQRNRDQHFRRGDASIRPSQAPGPIFLRALQPCRDMAPMIESRRISACPAFETRPSRSFPPEDCCRGTRPSHAAKSRQGRRENVAMFMEQAAQGIHIFGPLPEQPLAAAKQGGSRLLIRRLRHDEAHDLGTLRCRQGRAATIPSEIVGLDLGCRT